jgi:hypothetical protein
MRWHTAGMTRVDVLGVCDEDLVGDLVLARDEQFRGHAFDSRVLADGVRPEALVRAEFTASAQVPDNTGARCEVVGCMSGQRLEWARRGRGAPRKAEKRRFSPTKQMPILSAREAVGRPASCATRRTSSLRRPESGKMVRARLGSEMDER